MTMARNALPGNVAYVGTITTHYRTHTQTSIARLLAVPCTAGEPLRNFDYNGVYARASCVRSFGTLADHDYDFAPCGRRRDKLS